MGALDKVKPGIDLPGWLQMKPLSAVHATGTMLCCDKRNDHFIDPTLYYLAGNVLSKYSYRYAGNQPTIASMGIAATGAGMIFEHVTAGIYGVVAAGCTSSKLVSSTALFYGGAMSAVGVNQLIRTDLVAAYRVKVIGYGAGKVEYRTLKAHTAGATPTWYLDKPLSFTPAANDRYEIESGTLIGVGTGATAAAQARAFCIGNWQLRDAGNTGVTLGNNGSAGLALDENHVPADSRPGEGFLTGTALYDTDVTNGNDLRCLQATATASGTLTGQASGGDFGVYTNEYRNFQIRIVEDTGTPTAVGQRRMIASHTGGAPGSFVTPVYTLGAAWSVTPSSTAKYVIEYPNILIQQNQVQVAMLVLNYKDDTINNGTNSIAGFAWSSTYFNAAGATAHAGVCVNGAMAFSAGFHRPSTDPAGNRLSRHSWVWFFRGNSATLDLFDMSGGASGNWTNGVTYQAGTFSATTSTSGDSDAVGFDGEYAYLTRGATNEVYQFNVACPSLCPWTTLPVQSGTAADGQRVVCGAYVKEDAAQDDKVALVFVQSHLSTLLYRSDIIS